MINFTSISEIQILYKPKFNPSDLPKVSSSQDAYDILRSRWTDDIQYRESFAILLLNRANKCLGITFISKGGLSGTIADPKMVFQAGLKANASSIILSHNHPSGNTQASQNDIELTRKLSELGKLMEMPVLDHLILTDDTYFSFADEGLI